MYICIMRAYWGRYVLLEILFNVSDRVHYCGGAKSEFPEKINNKKRPSTGLAYVCMYVCTMSTLEFSLLLFSFFFERFYFNDSIHARSNAIHFTENIYPSFFLSPRQLQPVNYCLLPSKWSCIAEHSHLWHILTNWTTYKCIFILYTYTTEILK